MTKADEGKTSGEKIASQGPEPRLALTPAAQRALAEAQARRDATAAQTMLAEEIGGRGGLDPARYGDWEVKGVASDF
jgi:hypothetical protein